MRIFNKRTVLTLFLVLCALLTVTSTFEYLEVKIPATLTVVKPPDANIALLPGKDTWKNGEANAVYVADVSDYYLKLDLGPWGRNYKVTYSEAFKIKNLDDEPWRFKFDLTQLKDLEKVLKRIAISYDGEDYTTIWTDGDYSDEFGLDPYPEEKSEVTVLLEFKTDENTPTGSLSGTLILVGTEKEAPEWKPP